jgi:phosphoribosylaminoimidazole-succinocarboxamide synthase
MDKLNIAILASGQGSTLKAICDAVKHNILNLNIVCILSNFSDNSDDSKSNITKIGEDYGIKVHNYPLNKELINRKKYNRTIAECLNDYDLDVVVCTGWNYILNTEFINSFKLVINLHPALPNTFIGQHCIQKAYDAFQRGEIKYTGSMVHQVIEDVDKGQVLNTINIPIYVDDTYEVLETRVKHGEKGMLIQTLQILVNTFNQTLIDKMNEKNSVYNGKVRCVEDIGYNCLILSASDRLSAFDTYICDIPNKGLILNNISVWWFNKTKHILDNHYLYHENNHMIVKKTQPIKLEIIVRGYMTGSTNTSIWPMYNRGERDIYGIQFRDNYKKNEKLDTIIITPTTKGSTDRPITSKEIIELLYLNEVQWDFISNKALELFRFGQEEASKKDLLLVDTKYEFGILNDKIILIDELHTCDSSRYWLKQSYNDRFELGLEPEKLDKDAIRDWVKSVCDPYNDDIPEIPNNVLQNVSNVYGEYHSILIENDINKNVNISKDLVITNYFMEHHKEIVVILAGSNKDAEHVNKINKYCDQLNIYTINYYSSAHKNTRDVLSILEIYEKQNRKIVYVTVAGRSNALSGVVASNTRFPTIACPPFKDNIDFQVNINSTLICPSKVPVMTILEPENVAISINKIFNI